ncbi:MAG: hypothetical protein DRO18_04560 [Thermoprotei archaeon]|nr:MAG: hypothetical protein DRO18_04560 [Thermoprotei archaeon]
MVHLRKVLIFVAVICVVLLLLTLAMGLINSLKVTVTRYVIDLGGVKELKIVQLSDLHLKGFGDYEKGVVDIVVNEDPDIIVLTGDYVEDISYLKFFKSFIKYLRSRLNDTEVYAVIGNWELQAGTEDEVKKILEDYGIRLLVNDYVVTEVKGVKVGIIGLDDYLWGVPNYTLISELPDVDLRLLLVHEPSAALRVSEEGFKGLVLAGHCHGGQVKIFGIPLYLPRGCPPELFEGYHDINGTKIIVSKGIGSTFIPIRLWVNPEVVVIEAKV